MANVIDLTGQQFGSLIVLEQAGYKDRCAAWLCRCSCGHEWVVSGGNLRKSGGVRSCKSCSSRENLLGRRFGKVVVVEDGGVRKSKSTWWCRCDCGAVFKTHAAALKTGVVSACRQCGGSRSEVYNLAGRGYSTLWGMYRAGARRRGLDFNLTGEEFLSLVTSPCHYCGDEPRLRSISGTNTVWATGVDRVDSSIGYSSDNCVSSCSTCNQAKMELSYAKFVRHTVKVARRQGYAGNSDYSDPEQWWCG